MKNNSSVKYGIYLTFTIAVVTKKADKISLKWRNCHFGPNLRFRGTDFKELDTNTAKYQTKLLIYCVP